MNAHGLILAAGESSRMGYPKALLLYRGETFLDRLIALFAAHCSAVTVVLGAGAERIRAGIAPTPATQLIVNANYEKGMLTSLKCGLRAVPASAGAVLFTLVDHPAVAPETVRALTRGATPLLRIPRHGGRRGHPLLIGRALLPEFLALPDGAAPRDVVHRHLDEAEFLDTDDPGVLADIDDAAAYRTLCQEGIA